MRGYACSTEQDRAAGIRWTEVESARLVSESEEQEERELV